MNDIRRHKDKKAYEKIVADIPAMLNVLSLTQRALAVFKVYVVAQELISVIETNKILLESQLKAYKKKLEEVSL